MSALKACIKFILIVILTIFGFKHMSRLRPPFGRINAIIIMNSNLNAAEKLLYCLIATEQGSKSSSKLTNTRLQKYLGNMAPSTISHYLLKLKTENIIGGSSGSFRIINYDKSQGSKLVEFDVMRDCTLSKEARIYYAFLMATSDKDLCTKIATVARIGKSIKVSKNSFKKIRMELYSKGLLHEVDCGKLHKRINKYYLKTLLQIKFEGISENSIMEVYTDLQEQFNAKYGYGLNFEMNEKEKLAIINLLHMYDVRQAQNMISMAFENRKPRRPSFYYFLHVANTGECIENVYRKI
jgi:hypothetical protein